MATQPSAADLGTAVRATHAATKPKPQRQVAVVAAIAAAAAAAAHPGRSMYSPRMRPPAAGCCTRSACLQGGTEKQNAHVSFVPNESQ